MARKDLAAGVAATALLFLGMIVQFTMHLSRNRAKTGNMLAVRDRRPSQQGMHVSKQLFATAAV